MAEVRPAAHDFSALVGRKVCSPHGVFEPARPIGFYDGRIGSIVTRQHMHLNVAFTAHGSCEQFVTRSCDVLKEFVVIDSSCSDPDTDAPKQK